MKEIITPQGTKIKVETEIKFVISKRKKYYEEPFNRETTSRDVYDVNRKLMVQDLNTGVRYTDDVIKKWLEEGKETYATFTHIYLADVFCSAMNDKSYEELSDQSNINDWVSTIYSDMVIEKK